MAKKSAAITDAADDNTPGACYITDKQTGEQRCHLLTEAECTAQGGEFYGGPCGPFAEALKMVPKEPTTLKKTNKKAAKKTIKKSVAKKKRPE